MSHELTNPTFTIGTRINHKATGEWEVVDLHFRRNFFSGETETVVLIKRLDGSDEVAAVKPVELTDSVFSGEAVLVTKSTLPSGKAEVEVIEGVEVVENRMRIYHIEFAANWFGGEVLVSASNKKEAFRIAAREAEAAGIEMETEFTVKNIFEWNDNENQVFLLNTGDY